MPHFLENRKWSCSFRVENRLSIRIRTDVVLHSFLLETLRSLGLAAGGSRTGSGGPWGHHCVTFLLAWRILTKKRSVRECCLQEVNIRYIRQLWLESNHFQSTIKQERGNKTSVGDWLYGQKNKSWKQANVMGVPLLNFCYSNMAVFSPLLGLMQTWDACAMLPCTR